MIDLCMHGRYEGKRVRWGGLGRRTGQGLDFDGERGGGDLSGEHCGKDQFWWRTE